jgi:succinate dehydrogenase/fumarate reductase cytochrome b subunit
MPSVSTLIKMRAASGLVFGNFLAYHLFCHYSLYLMGWDAANENLVKGRIIYQNPLVESVLLLSLVLHMYSNTKLYMARRQSIVASKNKDKIKPKTSSAELKAHRIAGYIMTFSIVGHVIATRLAPLGILEADASLYDYGFVKKAAQLLYGGGIFFYAYLLIFAMAGGWHLIYGTRSAIATLLLSGTATQNNNKPVPIPLKMLAMINHILILCGLLAMSGYFYSIDTSDKKELHDKLYGAMGML